MGYNPLARATDPLATDHNIAMILLHVTPKSGCWKNRTLGVVFEDSWYV
jgi:hypothetical protein